MFLNSASNKIVPLRFLYLTYTPFVPRGIRTNCGPILMLFKSSKYRHYFRHETQSNHYEIHVFKFRINKITPLCLISLRYTLYVPPKVSVPIVNRFRGYGKNRKTRVFRLEAQSKQCEVYVFNFRINQICSTTVSLP